MTAVEIIEEIKRLPRAEQNRVIDFVRKVREVRPLTPDELGELAKEMVEAKDPAGADRLQAEIVRGFYGVTITRGQAAKSPHHLAMNELKPALHLAGCCQYRRDVWFQYRVPSHHFILIESGRIEAKTQEGVFQAGAH